MWELFGSYLLNSMANRAHFRSNWAGLAVLFSRKLPNGTHDFFSTFQDMFFVTFGFFACNLDSVLFHFQNESISFCWKVSGVSSKSYKGFLGMEQKSSSSICSTSSSDSVWGSISWSSGTTPRSWTISRARPLSASKFFLAASALNKKNSR